MTKIIEDMTNNTISLMFITEMIEHLISLIMIKEDNSLIIAIIRISKDKLIIRATSIIKEIIITINWIEIKIKEVMMETTMMMVDMLIDLKMVGAISMMDIMMARMNSTVIMISSMMVDKTRSIRIRDTPIMMMEVKMCTIIEVVMVVRWIMTNSTIRNIIHTGLTNSRDLNRIIKRNMNSKYFIHLYRVEYFKVLNVDLI